MNNVSNGFLHFNGRQHNYLLEVFGLVLYLPILAFAIYNFKVYIIDQRRYKQKPILLFYVMTIVSLTMRAVEFFLLIFYFYCNLIVIDVA
jgi:hypothetical protein